MVAKPVILCVDDERNVVESLQLNLRRHYEVHIALSAAEGLRFLEERGDVAVVLSDMRMPETDGAEFLAQVKSIAPDAVRMLLTGYADIEAAMRAVNEGEIFRFLTKPCAPEHLIAALRAGVEQYRLITAERELLQKTLVGCVRSLVEVLALSNPMALGRAVRIRERVRKVGKELSLAETWSVEVAALLSQLGAVSLPDETIRKLYDGERLEVGEQRRLTENMGTINKILANIPRLDAVTGILASVTDGSTEVDRPGDLSREARLLQAIIDLDSLEAQGMPLRQSLDTLGAQRGIYGEDVLAALPAVMSHPDEMQVTIVALSDVKDGMVLWEDLRTYDGILVLPRGFEMNLSSREHLLNFAGRLSTSSIKVLAPSPEGRDEPRLQSGGE